MSRAFRSTSIFHLHVYQNMPSLVYSLAVLPPDFHEHVIFTVHSDSLRCSAPTSGDIFPETMRTSEQTLLLQKTAFEMMQYEWHDLVHKRKRVYEDSDAHSYAMKLEYQTSAPADGRTLFCFSFDVCPLQKPSCKGGFRIS